MTTQLKINTEIKTLRVTDNSDIIKTRIITKCPSPNYHGMEVEFKNLKGTYKACIQYRGKWTFYAMKGDKILEEIK